MFPLLFFSFPSLLSFTYFATSFLNIPTYLEVGTDSNNEKSSLFFKGY